VVLSAAGNYGGFFECSQAGGSFSGIQNLD
jgi:hypothetical protein